MPHSLEEYRRKRDPGRTPEPFGGGAARPRLFVVQKHAARRLHWDFRLELDGVLLSWAVPRGPSFDPAEKRLAVHVEDHPVEYADFEGRIPAGNYGAGAVIVWDRGAWRPIEDPHEGLRKGKLLFELRGYKLHGVWQLVRTKGGPGKADDSKEWLLIKKPDAWAVAGGRPVAEESVLSGLSLEEMADGSRGSAIRAELEKLGPARRGEGASDALIDIQPMLAETAEAAFSRPGWLFELKYDGFRMIAVREGATARLSFRRGSDATARFPEIARAILALPAERLVMDGEVVVFDEEGHPVFQRLQMRAQQSRPGDIERAAVEVPATLVLFDLLGFEEFDLRALPLRVRKALLQKLLPRLGPLRYSDHVEEQGQALFAEVERRGLEGVMAKQADSPYQSGRSSRWQKVKAHRTEDLVIVGFTHPAGSREGFGALHLGEHDGGELRYVGRAGSGFSHDLLVQLRGVLDPIVRRTPPCLRPRPERERVAPAALPSGKGHAWVEPRFVCEVRSSTRTDDGLLRHPVFLRLRPDVDPASCVRTRHGEAVPAPPLPAPPLPAPPVKKVAFTNLDKLYWPDDGYTKGDLIDYYRAVAPWMLPWLRDRPLVITRYPDGIGGKSFFQHDAPPFVPAWFRTQRIFRSGSSSFGTDGPPREVDYLICDDVDSLLYLANLGTIPIHLWSSRTAALARPDWCVLDLDPKGAPFSSVVALARALHRLCDEMALPSYPKTSGQAGLHVLVPLGGQLTHEQARDFAGLIARAAVEELPEIATMVRAIDARGGKVYIDWLQNGHGKTIAAPLCVRPQPGAPVSTPLEWREVNARIDPARFTIRTVPRRLRGRPTEPALLHDAPDLAAALAGLERRLRPGERGRR